MSETHPPSIVPISGYPIQTVLMSFSGAYLIGALITDLAYWKSANMMWANFSAWQLVAGLVFGGLAILAGLVNIIRHRGGRSRGTAWLFLLGSVVVWALSLVNAFVHSRDAWTSVVPTGLVLSAATAFVLLIIGWIGWSSANRHRLGVIL